MTAGEALRSLNPAHPRLFLTPERLRTLNPAGAADPFLAELKQALYRQADALLACETTEFRIVGPRMLERSQQVLRRVATLALAFCISGRPEYRDRARTELLAVADFPHWNPDHFLDTAELAAAFAIGYDWLYDVQPEQDRCRIASALVEKALRPGLELQQKPAWWVGVRHNWNTVCNGGLAIGALAVADEQPELAAGILEVAQANLPLALDSFAPDGAWEAGPHYWEYTAWYSALVLDALKTALGTDLALSSRPGLDRAGLFPLYCAGPAGQYFNFADAETAIGPRPALFWLGQRFGLANPIAENHRLLRQTPDSAHPFDLLWYQPHPGPVPALPLAASFRRAEVFSARSAWDDPEALFLGFKAGFGRADHGHLDLGSFVMDADGVRWAADLGQDDYDLPGYWSSGADGGRWNYFRLNNRSHNTLVLNGHPQNPLTPTAIVRNSVFPASPFAIADLSPAYGRDAASVHRGAAILEGRAVLIQDEIAWHEASNGHEVRWQLTTDAEIAVEGYEAILTKAGRQLRVRILSPRGAGFQVESAFQEPPQNPNTGFRQLVLAYSAPSPATVVAVLLSAAPMDVEVRPLSTW